MYVGAAPLPEPTPAASELAAAKAALASLEAAAADLHRRIEEADAAVARGARRVVEAERWVATEVERAHNEVQPFVLLPNVLQRKIIDLLPCGR